MGVEKVVLGQPEHFEEENVALTPNPPPPQLSLSQFSLVHSVPMDQSRDTSTRSLQQPFISGTRLHLFLYDFAVLFGKRDFIPSLLIVRMDLLLPNTFLTLY